MFAYLETRGTTSHTYIEPNTPFGPLRIVATGKYYVDWGDGTKTGPHSAEGGPWPDGKIKHEYIHIGSYDVVVTERWKATWTFGDRSGTLNELRRWGGSTTSRCSRSRRSCSGRSRRPPYCRRGGGTGLVATTSGVSRRGEVAWRHGRAKDGAARAVGGAERSPGDLCAPKTGRAAAVGGAERSPGDMDVPKTGRVPAVGGAERSGGDMYAPKTGGRCRLGRWPIAFAGCRRGRGWAGVGGGGTTTPPEGPTATWRPAPRHPPKTLRRPRPSRRPRRNPRPSPNRQPCAVEPFRLIEEASAAAERIRHDAEKEAQRILAAARAAQDQETARTRRQAEREAASFRADAMAAAAKLTATAKTEADRVRRPGPGRRRQHPGGGVGRLRGAVRVPEGRRRGQADPGRGRSPGRGRTAGR